MVESYPNGERDVDEPIPEFKENLFAHLQRAEELPGNLTIEHDYVRYTPDRVPVRHGPQADPLQVTAPSAQRVPFSKIDIVDEDAPLRPGLYRGLVEYGLVGTQKAKVLGKALQLPDLQPEDITVISHQIIDLFPALDVARRAQGLGQHSSQLGVLLACRMLEQPARTSENLFATFAEALREEYDEVPRPVHSSGAKVTEFDRFMEPLSGLVKRANSKVFFERKYRTASSQDVEYINTQYGRYAVQDRTIAHNNAAAALLKLDEYGLIRAGTWRDLLGTPLGSQSFRLASSLAAKLGSENGAKEVLGPVTATERSRFIENVVAGALDEAATHEARDQRMLAQIRQTVTLPEREDRPILGKVIGLANGVIKQHYSGQLTPLRTEGSFTDVDKALALLLQITLKPASAASKKDRDLATEAAATYVRLTTNLIEQARVAEKPFIHTVGDLALRYADASPRQLQKMLAMLEAGDPVRKLDALRFKQLRGYRRKAITKPGYGKLS